MIEVFGLAVESFADQVLRELLVAVGAALFLGNLLALLRRNKRPEGGDDGDLERAPAGRTVVYLVIGLLVMIWGIGSLIAA